MKTKTEKNKISKVEDGDVTAEGNAKEHLKKMEVEAVNAGNYRNERSEIKDGETIIAEFNDKDSNEMVINVVNNTRIDTNKVNELNDGDVTAERDVEEQSSEMEVEIRNITTDTNKISLLKDVDKIANGDIKEQTSKVLVKDGNAKNDLNKANLIEDSDKTADGYIEKRPSEVKITDANARTNTNEVYEVQDRDVANIDDVELSNKMDVEDSNTSTYINEVSKLKDSNIIAEGYVEEQSNEMEVDDRNVLTDMNEISVLKNGGKIADGDVKEKPSEFQVNVVNTNNDLNEISAIDNSDKTADGYVEKEPSEMEVTHANARTYTNEVHEVQDRNMVNVDDVGLSNKMDVEDSNTNTLIHEGIELKDSNIIAEGYVEEQSNEMEVDDRNVLTDMNEISVLKDGGKIADGDVKEKPSEFQVKVVNTKNELNEISAIDNSDKTVDGYVEKEPSEMEATAAYSRADSIEINKVKDSHKADVGNKEQINKIYMKDSNARTDTNETSELKNYDKIAEDDVKGQDEIKVKDANTKNKNRNVVIEDSKEIADSDVKQSNAIVEDVNSRNKINEISDVEGNITDESNVKKQSNEIVVKERNVAQNFNKMSSVKYDYIAAEGTVEEQSIKVKVRDGIAKNDTSEIDEVEDGDITTESSNTENLNEGDVENVDAEEQSNKPEGDNANARIDINTVSEESDVNYEDDSETVPRRRIWNKKSCCPYCFELYPKLPRHLESMHSDIDEVKKALQLPKKCKERRQAFINIAATGNFAYSSLNLKKGIQLIIPRKRGKYGKIVVENYKSCPFCSALLMKNSLWKHKRTCSKRNASNPSKTQLLFPVSEKCTQVFRESILSRIRCDAIGIEAIKDDLIMDFGCQLINSTGSTKEPLYIAQKMRELGRFLLLLKNKFTDIHSLSNVVKPQRFFDCLTTIKELCRYDEKRGEFGIPSLALKIGQSLKQIASIVMTNASVSMDREQEKDAKSFFKLCDARLTKSINTVALRTLRRKRWNKPLLLPLAEDTCLMTGFLKEKAMRCREALAKSASRSDWNVLCQATLAQVTLFNRRRGGEAECLLLTDYDKRTKGIASEDIQNALSSFEQSLCQKLSHVTIRGKRNNPVPVLFTPHMEQNINTLIKHRATCKVSDASPYVFARPSRTIEEPYRTSDCIRTFAALLPALKQPRSLTTTRLRKHVAVMSQVVNLKDNELDLLASYMGHDIRVHRQYYRLPQVEQYVAKVGRILISMEKGVLGEFAGENLDNVAVDIGRVVDTIIKK